MKNRVKILLSILFVASFLGCGLLAEEESVSSTSLLQSVLNTNSSGYFNSDYTFTKYNYRNNVNNFNNSGVDLELEVKVVWSYSSNGNYSYSEFAYEKADMDLDGDGTLGEGFILFKVDKGSYTYKDYILTRSRESRLDYLEWYNDGSGNEYERWNSNPEENTYENAWVRSGNYYITESIHENLYKNSGENTWCYTYKSYWENSDNEPNINKEQYVITDTSITMTNSGSSYEREEVFEIMETFPGKKDFSKGAVIKFNGIYTTARERFYDYELEQFREWENSWNYGDVTDITFAHFGDFIVRDYALTDYSRGLE